MYSFEFKRNLKISVLHLNHLVYHLLILVLCYPVHALAVLPDTIANLLPRVIVNSWAFLFPVTPHAIILAAIRPSEDTVASLLVVIVFSLVLATIGPREHSASMHLIIDPVAGELTPISPLVLAVPVYVVVAEVSAVARHVGPEELAEAVLLA